MDHRICINKSNEFIEKQTSYIKYEVCKNLVDNLVHISNDQLLFNIRNLIDIILNISDKNGNLFLYVGKDSNSPFFILSKIVIEYINSFGNINIFPIENIEDIILNSTVIIITDFINSGKKISSLLSEIWIREYNLKIENLLNEKKINVYLGSVVMTQKSYNLLKNLNIEEHGYFKNPYKIFHCVLLNEIYDILDIPNYINLIFYFENDFNIENQNVLLYFDHRKLNNSVINNLINNLDLLKRKKMNDINFKESDISFFKTLIKFKYGMNDIESSNFLNNCIINLFNDFNLGSIVLIPFIKNFNSTGI